MIRSKGILLVTATLFSAALLALMNGCGGGSSANNSHNPPPPSKIQHVVVIFQENRTPDNLFQDTVLMQRGADIQNYGVNSKGTKVLLTPLSLATNWDNSHSHASFLTMYDGGKMDGADLIPLICGTTCQPPPDRPFNYVPASDVHPYYTLAETYTFGDRMFQTNQGPSFPAHQFIISGSSAPSPPGQPNSNLFVADNEQGKDAQITGCLAPTGQFALLIDPANPDPNTNETQKSFPCYDHPTLTDLLDNRKIPWRYYATTAGTLWSHRDSTHLRAQPSATQRHHVRWPHLATECGGEPRASPDRYSECPTRQRDLGDAECATIGPYGYGSPRQRRASLGRVDCQRHREQRVLVRYGDHHYLG